MADHLTGIGIDQEFVWVEALSRRWLVRPMHAIAVDRARPRIGEVAVPDLVGVLRQGDALDLASAVTLEQTELDLGRVGREQREVHAQAIPRRTKRIGQAFRE